MPPSDLAARWPWLASIGLDLDTLRMPVLAETRKTATRDDPLLFAVTYLAHHLASEETGGKVTLSAVHEGWAALAKGWTAPLGGPQEERDAFVAPRSMGKSTWWYLILPLWAAAHGHVSFVAAFADSATQAEVHLQTFRHELDSNELLRTDYPDLVKPAKRGRRALSNADGGTLVADNRGMLMAANDFVFAARGIDSGNLGMKVGNRRPELLILDDVEPGEAGYSAEQVKKRLGTIRDVVLPLNVNARVVIVGTVTMPGSIIHQLVRSVRGGELAEWVEEERVRVHYAPPILTTEDGTEVSVWPERWSMEWLESIRHTRTFLKNYANDPRGYEGGYWSDADFRYGELVGITRRVLSVDPAVTTKKRSDPTGIAVVASAPERRNDAGRIITPRQAQVELVEEVRLTGSALRAHCLKIVERWETAGMPIAILFIETNQGGDVWKDVFHGFPIPVRTYTVSSHKETRASESLALYQRGLVTHTRRFAAAEEQMVSYPAAPHDDMVDAVGAGVRRLLDPPKVKKTGLSSVNVA